MIKIAVDAMGGDNAPEITVKGAMLAVKKYKDLEIVLFGDEEKISKYLTKADRITIVHTANSIDMGVQDPISVMRRDKTSSMAMAMSACKDGECKAIVSAGPTQALIAGAHIILKRLKGVKRTALAPIIPSLDGRGRILLDVGANTEIKAEHVIDQAYFATVTAREVFGIENPSLGLLNIGTEVGKGRELENEIYGLLESNPNIKFYGNVEPKEILTTECDILITDGFTGNMVLKTLEGSLKGSGQILKQEIKKGFASKIGYLFMKKTLNNYKLRLSADEVGGAMLFGVSAPLVKAHGSSNELAFMNAIKQARAIVEKDVLGKVKAIIDVDGGSDDE